MSTIWLGDFRLKQIQQYIDRTADADTESKFLVEANADYSWLSTNAVAQLPQLYVDKADLVVMLGFNDCVYSCTWNSFNIETIASQYAKTIEELIELYPNLNFYFCSINPIKAPYPFSPYDNGLIPAATLETKIKKFNQLIKDNCTATFIDSYSYLKETGFDTRDGIRYTANTLEVLKNYIISQFKVELTNGAFLSKVRATEADAPKTTEDSFIYWKTSTGGLNECAEINNSGTALPNCVGYAWGRFYEITGEKPKLSTGNAGIWYPNVADGYERGSTPRVGAVICWSKPGEAGHVAIVESVDQATGTILTSESGYKAKTYDPNDDFWVEHRIYDSTAKNWRRVGSDGKATSSWIDSYVFQGFIYCPQTTALSKDDIYTGNNYITVENMKPNAQYIWQYLGSCGWTTNAIAGLLGNLQQESNMSPGLWESRIAGSNINADGTQSLNMTAINSYYSSHGRYPGYGLVQWTPYSKYTNWCAANNLNYWDIDSQLQRIEWEAANKQQWIAAKSKGYDLSFNDFITSTQDAAWLAAAFAFCYERPARSTGTAEEQQALRDERGGYGTFWYNYLSTLAPIGVADTSSKVTNCKIDKVSAGQIAASFIIRNGASCAYTLKKANSVLETGSFTELEDGVKSFSITSNKIIPKSSYILSIEITGTDGKVFSEELTVDVPQEYPETIKSIKLTCEDRVKTTDSKFKLTVVKPDSLGYWAKNSSGYDKMLFINNKCVKTITTDVKNINSESFTIKDEFKCSCNMGDSIQVGIRVWVKDDSKTKIYDSQNPKTSGAICLLNKSIIPYLNRH